MISLRTALSQLRVDGDASVITAPEGWTQGRTLYGGMTTALALAAVRPALPATPPLRSVQIAFVGPAAGVLRFQPSIVRQGRSSVVVAVDCASEAGAVARGTFIFGEGRESVVRHDEAKAPAIPTPDDCPSFFGDRAPGPEFFQNFEVRLAAGSRPVSGGGDPSFTAWVRFREDEGDDAIVALLALGDCLPPAAMVQFPKFAAISSMNWTCDLHHPIARGGWRLLRSTSEQAGDGYSLQAMEMWDEAGQRIAAGRQCVAVFI